MAARDVNHHLNNLAPGQFYVVTFQLLFMRGGPGEKFVGRHLMVGYRGFIRFGAEGAIAVMFFSSSTNYSTPERFGEARLGPAISLSASTGSMRPS